ncbi:MAG: hypothetical protein DRO46_00505, partial [Candidatus Hecatellales archaeon]
MAGSEPLSFGLTIDEELCSRCSLCVYTCPFEALTLLKGELPEERKVEVDREKCKLCGLCYTICPLDAITVQYYSMEDLLEMARQLCLKTGERSLVVACKGSNPTDRSIEEKVGRRGIPVLRVPCAGRVPMDFYFRLLSEGVADRLHVLPCEEEFCRLKEGGKISFLKLDYLRSLLAELKVDGGIISLTKSVNKAKVNEAKCIGCGNCEHY